MDRYEGIVVAILIGAAITAVLVVARRRTPAEGTEHETGTTPPRTRPRADLGPRQDARTEDDPYRGLPAGHVITRAPMVWDAELGRDVTLRDWLRSKYDSGSNLWNSVVAEFYTRAAANPRVAEYFTPTMSAPDGVADLQNHFLRALLLMTSSGVSVGVFRAMRKRHTTVHNLSGDPIDGETYDQVLDLLIRILREHRVPDDGIDQLAATVAPLRSAVACG